MRRAGTVVVAIAGFLLVGASPAFAHATVSPEEAEQGSDIVLTFVVPNEEEHARTTKVLVQFPTDHPIAEALVAPVAGWTWSVKMRSSATPIETDSGSVKESVSTITWTATGAGITVRSFGQFSVSVGLPRDADQLEFPTVQTYSDGTVVNWIQPEPPGGPEPDDPVPVITLTAPSETSAVTPTTNGKTSDDTAKTIAIVALAVAALGLFVGAGGIVLARRRSA